MYYIGLTDKLKCWLTENFLTIQVRIQVGIRIALPEKMVNLNISRKNETRCRVDYWSVSNSVKLNNQLLAKKPRVYFIGIHGNNMAKFIHYLILANTVISKLKWNQNVSVIFPYLYSINGHEVSNFYLAPWSLSQLEYDSCTSAIVFACKDRVNG